MRRDVVTASGDDTVAMAVKEMAQRGIGAVIVVEFDGRTIGIFTERDLLVRVVAKGLNPAEVKISEVMTRNPIAARDDWSAAKALEIMAYYGFRHLPVVDERGVLVGIVSIKDIVKSIVEEIDVAETTGAD